MTSMGTRIARRVADEFRSATCTNRRALLAMKEGQADSFGQAAGFVSAAKATDRPWPFRFVSLVFLMLACLALPQQAAAQTPPQVDISFEEELDQEEGTVFRFTVNLSAALLEARTFNIEYPTFTPSSGDFDPATLATDLGSDRPTTLTIGTGVTEMTFDVPTVQDNIAEKPEVFSVRLSVPTPFPTNPRNLLVLDDARANNTIRDNDTAAVQIFSQRQVEHQEFRFRITTNGARSERAIPMTWTVTDGTASVVNDLELSSTSGSITLPASVGNVFPQAFLRIPINNDNLVESDETFTVTLSPRGTQPAGVVYNPGMARATGTITDSNTLFQLSPAAINPVVEGRWHFFTINLNKPLLRQVYITWTATSGTATVEEDLERTTGQVFFPAGSMGPVSFVVPSVDDTEDEADETYTVTIRPTDTLPFSTFIDPRNDSRVVTLRDNDEAPAANATVSIDNESVVENGGAATFTAELSRAVGSAVVLDVAVTAGTATLAEDLGIPLPTSVTIDANTTEATFTVPIEDDEIVEGNETFTVTLSENDITELPDDVIIRDGTAIGTITENDTAEVTLSPDTATVFEDGEFTYTVSLDAAADEAVTVRWTATAEPGDTATVDDDLRETTGTVTFNADTNADQTFTISPVNDTDDEANETFTVTLGPDSDNPLPTGVSIGADNRSTATITDDDTSVANATVSIDDESVVENVVGGTVTFTAALDRAVGSAVVLDVAVTAGTATLAEDLRIPLPTSVTIDANTTEATFTVPIEDDEIVEGNETFTVTLSENDITELPDGVIIRDGTATGTIEDDDRGTVTLSPDIATAAEDGEFTYTVRLSAAADEAVTVRWTATAEPGDTATVDDDLQETTNTVTFAANDNTDQTFTISPVNDTDDEANETFTVTLGQDTQGNDPLPTGVTIGADNSSAATITDNDDAPPPENARVSIADMRAVEGAGAIGFTVSLSRAVDSGVTLAVAYTAGSADPGTDLGTPLRTTVTIPEGETRATLAVPVIDDVIAEGVETFTVTLSEDPANRLPDDVSIGDGVATGTITDNDEPPGTLTEIRIADAAPAAENGIARFTVSLSRAVDSDVTLAVAYGAGSVDPATPTNDLGADRPATVTIAEGETRATLTVPIIDDVTVEGEETFTVTVGEDPANRLPADVIITDNEATGTITEDDRALLSLSPARLLATEPARLPATERETFRYTVRLSAPVDEAFDVGWFSGAGAGDVEETRGTVRFEANDTADRTFTIVPVADDLDEPHETFTVAIGPGSVVPPPAGVRIDYDNYSSTATILDGSAGAWVNIADASVDENGGAVAFTVSLNRAVAGDVVFDVAYAAGSASLSDLLVGGPDRVTIDEGDTSTTFDVPVGNDELVEGDETFTVTLSETRAYPLPADMIILDGTATGTIRNDDTALVSVSPTTADRTTIAFRVGLSNPLTEALTLGWTATVESGAGTADPLSGTVTIRAGGRSAPITIDAVGLPSGGTLTVRLSDTGLPPRVQLDDRRDMATHQLRDLGRVSIANADPVAEGAGPALFTVSLSRAVADDVWLLVAYEHRSASRRDLGNRLPASVLIAEGKTSAILSVPIIDDDIVEGRESFTVTISEYPVNPLPAGVSIADGTATGTITDEGGPVPVLVSLSPSPTQEGTVIVFGVDLTNPLEADLALGWTATVEPGANPRDDRDPFSGTVTVPEGDVSAPLMIDTAGLPPGRHLIVRLSDAGLPSGVLLDADRDASGDIIPPTPAGDTATVSLSPRVTEEETAVVFTVNLTDPLREDLALGWTATEIPEFGEDPDPSDPLSGTVTVEAGDTSAGIMIDIRRLTVGATLVVRLSDAGLPPGVQIDPDRDMTSYLIPGARLPETATVSLSPRVTEEETAVVFTVNLTDPLREDLALGWTATEIPEFGEDPDPSDPLSGTVTVEAGDTSAGIMIDIRRLTVGATLVVRLSDAGLPPNVQIDPDRDMTSYLIPGARLPETATVSLSPRVTDEGGTAIIFTVNMSNPLTRDLAVGWTATEIPESGVNPDPGDPLSGTVTVEAGDISAGIMINLLDLTTLDATLLVRLSNAGLPPNVQIDPDRDMTSYLPGARVVPLARIASAASVAAVSIEDADPVAAGAGPARFMVSLSQSVDSDVVLDVDYGVSNGAGLASLSDLGSARPASVTITMGATEATLDVPIVVDDFAEDEETFTVTLTMNTAPDGVIIADGSATGTITQSRGPSVLVEPRRVGAGAALRRHVSRFDSMTGTVVRNRLRGSGMHDLSFSAEVTEDRQDVTVSSQPFTGRWGTWIDGAWAGIDGNASGRQADIYGGVDYLGADGDWLIGALIGYELADLDIGEATFQSNTVQFGLYGGARLSEQLMFDGAFAYGTATPEVGLDDVSGSYDAQRFTVRGALTGDFGLGTGQGTGQGSSVRFEPQLGVLYSSEKLGAFTDSVDRMAKSETLEIGRLTAGPRVTRDFDGGQVTAGARIQWDFLGLDDGVDGRVSGAADVGLRLELAPGVTFGVHGDIDGIGIGDDFGSIGGRFELGVRF